VVEIPEGFVFNDDDKSDIGGAAVDK